MLILQLKPKEQTFYQMARNLTKKLKIIMLCEGKEDVETLKALIAKIEIPCRNIGITDCEGISTLKEIAVYIATLARIARKLEKIALVVDADEQTVEQRFQSLLEFLKARGLNIKETLPLSEALYKIKIDGNDLVLKIAGNLELPFQRHTMEDHLVKLLLLNGSINDQQLGRTRDAKTVLAGQERAHVIIKNSLKENVEQAYGNIIEFLKVAIK
jgi:5S rRNA maturation endonuclease (ribonuclease M5)